MIAQDVAVDRSLTLREHGGVETRAHWDLLQNLGCDIAQGYFIAKPMEASAFEDWKRDWRPPE